MSPNRREFIKTTAATLAMTALPIKALSEPHDTLKLKPNVTTPHINFGGFKNLPNDYSPSFGMVGIPDYIREQVESEQYGSHSLEWHVENAKNWPIRMHNRDFLIPILGESNKLRHAKEYDYILTNENDVVDKMTFGCFPQMRWSEIRNPERRKHLRNNLIEKTANAFIKLENKMFESKSESFRKQHLLAIRKGFNNIPVLNIREMRIGWICYEELGWYKYEI